MSGPYYRRERYVARYAADGTDLHSVARRVAELARARTDDWIPEHEPTRATWEPRRLIEESPGHTYDAVQAMAPEEIADALDFLQILRDRQLWQHAQQRPHG